MRQVVRLAIVSGVIAVLVGLLEPRTAAANMTLDMDLLVCADSHHVPNKWNVGRVSITDGGGAVVQQVEDVEIYFDDHCSAKFALELSPATLDLYLSEDLFITVETCCGWGDGGCTFADDPSFSSDPMPMNTILDDVFELILVDLSGPVRVHRCAGRGGGGGAGRG